MSDTHSSLDKTIFEHFKDCDEIWHAGDIGKATIIKQLSDFKPLKAVYGNIDDKMVRAQLPRDLRFNCEGLEVFITHIGGYPGRYNRRVKKILDLDPPGLFICGHSHILKVMPDYEHNLLHMNPGACGEAGFHRMKTLLRFDIESGKISNLEVIELGLRGRSNRS